MSALVGAIAFAGAFIGMALFSVASAIRELNIEKRNLDLYNLGRTIEKISDLWLDYEKHRLPRR